MNKLNGFIGTGIDTRAKAKPTIRIKRLNFDFKLKGASSIRKEREKES